MMHKSIIAAAALATSALVPSAASAAAYFDFSKAALSSVGSSDGNVRTFVATDGTKVEASAYSVNNGSLSKSYLGHYTDSAANKYGLGVTSNEADSWYDHHEGHEIDNADWTDYIVLQFDKMVSVSELGLYGFGDTDLTWAVGTTATAFSETLSFANFTQLDNAFGAFNSSDGLSSSTYKTRPVAGTMGNLFLVAAASKSDSNDKFKLSSLTANVAAVPEPATWAMMMMGLGLAGAMMRRSKANTAVSFA